MNVIVTIALISCASAARSHLLTSKLISNTNTTSGTSYDSAPAILDNTSAESGRDKKVEKYLIPAVVGFKLTSLATAVFTALKIFIVQSFIVSKIALLGATVLAIKVLYDHMRHKGWDAHYHYKQLWPEWPWPLYPHTDPWSAGFDSYPSATDLHAHTLATAQPLPLPHVHGNTTFYMRSDNVHGGGGVVPAVAGDYGTIVTRISETTSDD